jgi:DNA-binding CsgD family transcriptional regulator
MEKVNTLQPFHRQVQKLAMKERDRIIWQLKCDGKSVRDICKIMNIALQTAQSAINRQRAKNKAENCG